MRRDSVTLKDLDERGHDVRAWCFECQRGERIDTIIWQKFEAKGWPMSMTEAARRFRCKQCRTSEHVALFPARRPPMPPNAPERLVELFFHGMRSAGKRNRRGR